MRAPQSSPASIRLPAAGTLVSALLLHTVGVAAQSRTLVADASFTKEPQGVELAVLSKGTSVRTGAARGDWVEVTIDGWVFTQSTEATSRDGFDLAVTASNGENLRRAPNGAVVARLRTGALLARIGRQGGWTQVRRTGWIPRRSLGGGALTASSGATAAQAQEPDTARAAENTVQVASGADLFTVPDGGALGRLNGGAHGRVLSRSGDWVRVQVDGWVKAADLTPAAEGVLLGVSAAEVRAAPERFMGKVVEWRLQVIAVQTADELRPEMAPGQLYVLTRGPLPEPGFVYVTVTPAEAERFRAISPLGEVTVRATVRAARTRYLATPIVQFVSRVDPTAR